MLKLALDHPKFKVSTLEIDRKGTSYTIDALKELKSDHLRLILSDEAAAHLDGWKDSEELRRIAPPLVAPRTWGISSTEIRDRLKRKLYCSHLIPLKTLDYIRAHDLYSS